MYILLVLPYYLNTININTVININLKSIQESRVGTPTPLSKNPYNNKTLYFYRACSVHHLDFPGINKIVLLLS